jgi:IS30 family transposase
MRQLAKQLGLSPSTVSREIARNGGRCAYRAAISDARAWERTLRPKQCVLAGNSSLREIVAQKLQEDWSPQQIAGWLKRTYQNDSAMQLSHETIYRSLFIQARGILNKALISHLRSRCMMRRGKHSTTAGQPRGQIVDAVSISERPAEVEDRAIPGHWEGDLTCLTTITLAG